MSLPDTSGQDRPVTSGKPQARRRRRWLVGGARGPGLLLLAGWLVPG